MIKGKKILALGAHPDDIELSSGGSINKWSNNENDIYCAVFSPCTKSLPLGYGSEDLFNEMRNALTILGVKENQIHTRNFEVREFPRFRQEILEELILLRNEIRPDIVLIPNSDDIHQDHHQIFCEGRRAFKFCSLLGYELPWNNLQFKNTCSVKLTVDNVKSKIDALKQYKSQSIRSYMNPKFIESLASVRGAQANTEYAETFELLRMNL